MLLHHTLTQRRALAEGSSTRAAALIATSKAICAISSQLPPAISTARLVDIITTR